MAFTTFLSLSFSDMREEEGQGIDRAALLSSLIIKTMKQANNIAQVGLNSTCPSIFYPSLSLSHSHTPSHTHSLSLITIFMLFFFFFFFLFSWTLQQEEKLDQDGDIVSTAPEQGGSDDSVALERVHLLLISVRRVSTYASPKIRLALVKMADRLLASCSG